MKRMTQYAIDSSVPVERTGLARQIIGLYGGGSRLSWIGGRWTDRDAHGNVIREAIELRQEPKYAPIDRWHIERWLPPEAYGTPDEWAMRTTEVENGIRIPALGPYPSRGEYEHCFT